MSFIQKGDFKTREEWLKRQKKALLKKQQEKYKQMNQISTAAQPKQQSIKLHQKKTLGDILTLETEHSIKATPIQQPKKHETTIKHQFKRESDQQLYYSMQEKQQQMQEIKHRQRTQIKALNKAIQQIKTDNAILKGINSQAMIFYKDRNHLQNDMISLKQTVNQMEMYLNQHGAFWQGTHLIGQLNLNKIKQDIHLSKNNYRTLSAYQYQTILKRVEELNQGLLKELGSRKIVNAMGVHLFQQMETLQVSFYSNGVYFYNFQFYLYQDRHGIRILDDLTDGYFPHVLKDKYPEGVYLSLINQMDKQFTNNQKQIQANKNNSSQKPWFFGQGHSIAQ